MARIQKKKTASKKILKQSDVASDGSGPMGDAGNAESSRNDTGFSVAKSGAEKKKKIFSVRKPSSTGQSAVLNLADKYFGNWIQFFREVKVELAKVTWPNKKQTIGSTAVVIVFVFVVAFFLGIVDIGLSNLIRLVL